jgi:uncharacterized glyoxalase superfamily protein PhnB
MENSQFEIILYVENQEKSSTFYRQILELEPSLEVPGMTEFILADNLKLGLMPNQGISKIITPVMLHPNKGTGIPRCELYIKTQNAEQLFANSLQHGALLVSNFSLRNWGDSVGYVADPDGHIIAFAK